MIKEGANSKACGQMRGFRDTFHLQRSTLNERPIDAFVMNSGIAQRHPYHISYTRFEKIREETGC